jgi:hypothetical protein
MRGREREREEKEREKERERLHVHCNVLNMQVFWKTILLGDQRRSSITSLYVSFLIRNCSKE